MKEKAHFKILSSGDIGRVNYAGSVHSKDVAIEPAREICVRDEVDVLAAGGGLGGVSAAVAAARAGAKALLIERNGFPGGVATAGMCCSVFNCFYTPSHELVVKGNALEFVEELAKAEGPRSSWHNHKGHIIYDIERGKLVLIELLEKAGVDYLFDTIITNVIMEGNVLQGVFIESKSGREAVKAKVIVDATGDADVAHFAGAPLHQIHEKMRARHSYCFRVGNVDVDKLVNYFIKNPDQYPQFMDVDWDLKEAIAQYKKTGTFLFPHGGGMQLESIKKGVASGEYKTTLGVYNSLDALQMHAIRNLSIVHIVTGFCSIDDMDVSKITRAMTDGKRMAFYITDYFQQHIPGFEKACVIGTADDLGMRATRWIDGEFVFTEDMRSNPTKFKDAIGRGVVQRNYVKNKAAGAWSVQTFIDQTFDVPYRCLLPRGIEGLLMGAGRSVSASNPFLLRTMALTMVVGQGAGAAAAVSAQTGVTPRNVNIAAVQEELERQGVSLNNDRSILSVQNGEVGKTAMEQPLEE